MTYISVEKSSSGRREMIEISEKKRKRFKMLVKNAGDATRRPPVWMNNEEQKGLAVIVFAKSEKATVRPVCSIVRDPHNSLQTPVHFSNLRTQPTSHPTWIGEDFERLPLSYMSHQPNLGKRQ